MQEIFKDVEEYEGLYQISNLGRVKSLERETWNGNSFIKHKKRFLRPGNNGRGYQFVNLSKNNIVKRFYVHRLVAKAFLIEQEDKKEVNHINGLKGDNSLKNLEWVSSRENNKHARDTGLVNQQPVNERKYKRKPFKCVETNEMYFSLRDAENKLGIPHRTIGSVLKKQRKSTRNLSFIYI